MAEQIQQPVGGFVSLMGGMHAGVAPEILGETAYSRGINVQSRGGLVKTRPGFARDLFLGAGAFQGMAPWQHHDAQRLVIVKGGHVLVVDTATNALTDLGEYFPGGRQCYIGNVERYFMIQDTVNEPVVLDVVGGSVQARPHAVPKGASFVFAHGRIHISPNLVPGDQVNGRPYFISGDGMLAHDPATCLEFIENDYWNGGGAVALPLEMGYVTAFGVLRNAATGTGYGGVIVFAERGVSAFDLSIDRSLWADEPLGQVLFFGHGTQSPWSVVSVNGTLVYRATDGLRIMSYTIASKQSAGETLSSVAQSAEVAPFFTRADAPYLATVSAAACDNRVFMTVGGTPEGFKALVVLDSARISEVGNPSTQPAYDGIWQIAGRKFCGVASVTRAYEETLYAVLDDGYLWRLDPDATSDNGQAITARLVTRSYFGDMGPTVKRVVGADVSLCEMQGDVSIKLYYRPTGYPLWALAGERVFKVGAGSLAQRRRRAGYPFPSVGTGPHDPVTKEPLNLSSQMQFCLEWTGPCAIQMFRSDGLLQPETAAAPCPETAQVAIAEGDAGVALGEYLDD